jgi:hypothetical protein
MTASSQTNLDTQIRSHIYDVCLARGRPPTVTELAAATGQTADEVRAGLNRLAAGRIIVLQQESGEVLMANPFSAVPTPFVVETRRYTAFGNCIWDALGIPAMLREPATIRTACGCCGEAITLAVEKDALAAASGVVHFAVPAARWWEDIVFT